MTMVTEGDLKRLEDLINNRFGELDRKIGELDRKIDGIDKKLDVYIAKTDEQLKALNNTIAQSDKRTEQRFDDTNKRIDEVNARINTFSLGFLGIVGILVTGLLGIVGNSFIFPQPLAVGVLTKDWRIEQCRDCLFSTGQNPLHFK